MDDLSRIMDAAPAICGSFRLDGRKALIVGGTKGLGQAMAVGLAAAGADVCVSSRGPGGLDETREAIKKLGRKGFSIAADAGSEEQVEMMMRRAHEQLGGLDILINSQGKFVLNPTVDFELEDWQQVMDVNVKSMFLCCKHAGRIMLKDFAETGGARKKIINISSIRAFQGRAGDPAYATSKGAVNQLTRSLAIEWGPLGINVNGLAPVFTLTAISAGFLGDPEKKNWVLGRIPMKRLGELEDVIGPSVFLASDASDFVNGHTLPVDGGWLSA